MKRILCAMLCAAFAMTITACNTNLSANDATQDSIQSSSDEAQNTNAGSTLNDGNYDLSFTDRDCDSSYEESSACKISFSGSSASVASGSGANISGTTVTINSEGTYIISGSCSDGQLIVNADKKDKVQLVLDGLDLTSSTSPLVIQKADKVFITLAPSSENTLSDASSYELTIDDSTVDAAIFSKADLTINGSGSLNVNGNYKHSIVSKDDLVITGGTINATSATSAIDGKDCVKIKSADITVNSGGDGIRSTNADETDSRGFVYIADGSFNLTCTNDGIQACSLLRIDGGSFDITTGGGSSNGKTHTDSMGFGRNMKMYSSDSDTTDTESAKGVKCADTIKLNGGTFNVNSSDDAIHSNNEILMTDGSLTIATGDDGMHADNTLTINGGTIKIDESYEGIEAGEITVNDGNISVVSSDDGFNAAGGSNGTHEEDFFSSDSSKSLVFNGGYTFVNASGDGIDSNGTITITGGTILVSGPEDSNNAAVDYETSATITGGVLLALGSSGMAEAVTGDGQGSILTTFDSQNANTAFAICDSSGNVIASMNCPKSYNCVVVSTPEIKSGETYTLVCGGTVSNADSNGYASGEQISSGTTVSTIEMTSDNYSSGAGMGGMNGGMNGGMDGGKNGGMGDDNNFNGNDMNGDKGMGGQAPFNR